MADEKKKQEQQTVPPPIPQWQATYNENLAGAKSEYDLASDAFNKANAQYNDYKPYDMAQAAGDFENAPKPMYERFARIFPKPEQQLTPEQEQKARLLSGISAGLAGLGEMFAHNRGATVRDRDVNAGMNNTNARLEKWRQQYENDLYKYNTGLFNAENADWTAFLNDKDKADVRRLQMIMNNYNLSRGERDAARGKLDNLRNAAMQMQHQDYNMEQQQAFQEKMRKADQIFQAGENAKQRALQYSIHRNSGGGNPAKNTGANGVFQITINPNDKTSAADYSMFGKSYKNVQLTPQMQVSLWQQAISNEDFMTKHNLWKYYKDDSGEIKREPQGNPAAIISAYLQEQYDNSINAVPQPNQWFLGSNYTFNPLMPGLSQVANSPVNNANDPLGLGL